MDILLTAGIAALPTPLALLVAVGVPVLLAFAVGSVMYAVFTEQDFLANAQVGAIKYSFVVEVYAVVAALSLVGAWDIYQSARDQLQKETGALYLLALSVDTYGLPEQAAERDEMRGAIRGYAAEVVTNDWQAMQLGRASSQSDDAFQRLARAYLDVDPVSGAQQTLQQNTAQWIAQVAEARIARLSVMSRTLSGLIWALVLTTSVAVISFQWFFGGANVTMHYAMGLVIAIIVGGVLLVSLRLAFPFVGDPPLLSPRPFYELMQVN
jgi:membrane protein YdbS with pleckstrin-like domain